MNNPPPPEVNNNLNLPAPPPEVNNNLNLPAPPPEDDEEYLNEEREELRKLETRYGPIQGAYYYTTVGIPQIEEKKQLILSLYLSKFNSSTQPATNNFIRFITKTRTPPYTEEKITKYLEDHPEVDINGYYTARTPSSLTGLTPLMALFESYHPSFDGIITALLKDERLNINKQSLFHKQPLLYFYTGTSLLMDNIFYRNILKREDLNINLQNIYKDTILHLLGKEKRPFYKFFPPIFQEQKEKININLQNVNGETALHTLVKNYYRYEDGQIIGLLLQIPSIDVNIKNNEQRTALQQSILSLQFDNGRTFDPIIKLFNAPGANLNSQDKELKTVLHYIVEYGYIERGTMLIQYFVERLGHLFSSIDADAVDIKGETAYYKGLITMQRYIKFTLDKSIRVADKKKSIKSYLDGVYDLFTRLDVNPNLTPYNVKNNITEIRKLEEQIETILPATDKWRKQLLSKYRLAYDNKRGTEMFKVRQLKNEFKLENK